MPPAKGYLPAHMSEISLTHCNTLQNAATHCNNEGCLSARINESCTKRTHNVIMSGSKNCTKICTTLHHTAPHCTTLHHTAPHCTTLHHTATGMYQTHMVRSRQARRTALETALKTAPHCTTLHHTAPHCPTLHQLHHTAPHCTTLHHTAPHCTTLHHTTPHYTALQHTGPHCCNTHRWRNKEGYLAAHIAASEGNTSALRRVR